MYSPELIDIVLVSQLDMLVIVFALLLLPVFRCDCALCLRCYTVAFQPRGLYRAFVVSAVGSLRALRRPGRATHFRRENVQSVFPEDEKVALVECFSGCFNNKAFKC